ncbi:MAG TPA: O-acetyl-ADP-ribose deacetylase [Pyrinomonadaceae bacterium]|nr:O-acetyl-ADP-ribose deacetylase [Pyrinomonadaceae bacterium]
MHKFFDGRLIVKVGDLTDENADAIVNAANSTLLGGGGVDGAIHSRGGPSILAECRMLRNTRYQDGLPTGEAVITTAGRLPSKFVIHTVGPIFGMNGGRDAELLAACYRNSLDIAAANSLSSIAFPSISTGAFGYPKPEAAGVVWRTLSSLIEVYPAIHSRLVFHTASDADIFIEHTK